MRTPRRGALAPLGLAAAAYALALAQRPGTAVADTKIDLHVDPAGFLADVASLWSSSGGLGQVQAGQYAGYLFPMGPFFALGHALGLSPWLVQRLWLGTLLALAAWGVVRLLDSTWSERRGVAHVAAGALVLLNPYVVVFANRTSVTLLGYAALPWLLLVVHRAMADPRGWRMPAAFALVLAATGGGVNAAVTGWLLVGPLLLLAYEASVGGAGARAARAVLVRTAPLALAASLWWIVPVAAHARYGLNFLPFTESAGAIWATSSASEALRLMGYWVSYLGVGFGDRLVPYFDTSDTMLFSLPVVLASLIVPALALAGFAWTRRWRYGPFFLLMGLAGLVIVMAGYPDGTPLRRVLEAVYYRAEPVQFLRTSYKAAPLLAIALACLGGAAAARAWAVLGARGSAARALAAALGLALLVLSAWPLARGRAIDSQVAYGELPSAWERAAADLDRDLPAGTRAMVLPGQVFPFYRWGSPQDPILPSLSERPVAVRYVVPYADLHAADLLLTTDALVQQRRVLPGQLPPLLDLLGVGAVVAGSDDDPLRSGSVEPAAAAGALREGGLAAPTRRYGPARRFAPPAGEPGAPRPLPQVRRHDLPPGAGVVRVRPAAGETLVDGSAEGLAALASLGGLASGRALLYAADGSPRELRAAAERGAELVVTDSNRRRSFLSSRVSQSHGPVLAAAETLSRDAARLDPFGAGADAETVARYEGVRALRAPLSPNFPQFPEHRPYAALDGRTDTWWAADRHLDAERHWLEIEFERPRDVPFVELLAQRETDTVVEEVELAGRRVRLRPGWNRIRTGLREVERLRVRIAKVDGPDGDRYRGPGAIAELRVPGVSVRELLRPPVVLERALAGAELDRSSLSYVFARQTGDEPFRRAPRPDPQRGAVSRTRSLEAALVAEPGDPEQSFSRLIRPPATREFRADGWLVAAPGAPDSDLDRIAGERGGASFESSGRLLGLARHRASRAFDGDGASAWLADRRAGATAWVSWRTPRALSVRRIGIEPAPGAPAPTAVRLVTPGGQSRTARVPASGELTLDRPLRARELRLEVLSTRGGERSAAAVGIAELRVPGLPRHRARSSGALAAGCDVNVRAGAATLRLRPAGSVADLEAGRALRALPCGRPARLPAAPIEVEAPASSWVVHVLRLRSPAPAPPPAPPAGRVLDPGDERGGARDGVRVDLAGPSWLVLGESYNVGWRASCGGESLGRPRVLDGFANGWRAGRSCRDVRFWFAPNAAASASYWISALAGAGLLLLLALGRRGPAPLRGPELPAVDAPARLRARRALALAAAVGVACAFLFALRAGLVIGLLTALVLWRGIGPRALALAAGVLLAGVVPLLYAILLPEDRGGFNSTYAADLIAAHWMALTACVLLALALWRTLVGARPGAVSTARGRSGGRAGEPAGAGAPAARP